MEKSENPTEEYIKIRGITDKARIQQVWLGMLAGLRDEDLDLFCLDDYSPKQRDYIRIALEEGMPREEVKRQLCGRDLDSNEILKKKREYFLNLDSRPIVSLVTQIEERLRENNQMAEFIKEKITDRNNQQEEDNMRIHALEIEIARLKNHIEEMGSKEDEKTLEPSDERVALPEMLGEKMELKKERINGMGGFFGKMAAFCLEKEERSRQRKKGREKVQDSQEEDIFALLCAPELEVEQIRELMDGYQKGLPVDQIKRYASAENSADKMRELKEYLLMLKTNQEK